MPNRLFMLAPVFGCKLLYKSDIERGAGGGDC